MSGFPEMRLRRLRRTPGLRKMFDMPIPGPERFMYPVFITDGTGIKDEINAMPGQYRLSVDRLAEELGPVVESGIGSILLFGVAGDASKDGMGSCAYDENGVVQRAIAELRSSLPDIVIATDVCLCAYTDHGHCGPLDQEGNVDNDATLDSLARTAVSHAQAGADIVAPSAMMDGQVLTIRQSLDDVGFNRTIVMSYSSKFCSAMYGPFREAEESAPQVGDRKSYQAPFGDVHQAIRESEFDEQEGADILMVKPSIFYLDIISKLRECTHLPIAAYNVSGEYSMLIAAADRGWGDLKSMVRESIVALARAGTDVIISYWASRYDEIIRGE